MERIRIIPVVGQTLFGPRVTVFTTDGRVVPRQATGREFIWDFPTHVARMAEIGPSVAIGPAGYQRLAEACATVETLPDAASALARLTRPASPARR